MRRRRRGKGGKYGRGRRGAREEAGHRGEADMLGEEEANSAHRIRGNRILTCFMQLTLTWVKKGITVTLDWIYIHSANALL